MRRYRELLRRRDFRLLWVGATLSALGDGMSFVALVWLTIERGGTPATVGWLAAAYTGPVILGGFVAGVILDRFDRRKALIADNLLRGIVLGSVPLAAIGGWLTVEHLFLVALVYGLLFMTSLAGIPAMIPGLVEESQLTTANAMESLSYTLAGLAGPALAGVVIAVAGAPAVLAIDAATYFAFTACLLFMAPQPPQPVARAGSPTNEAATGRLPARAALAEAVRFVVRTPAIAAITLMYMAVNVGEGIFIVLAPVYARDVLGGGATTYGLLLSSFTGGALLGAVVVGAIRWRWPLGRSIAAATLLVGLVQGLLITMPGLEPAVLLLATAGALGSSLTAWAQTIRMRLIPPELRGRTFALLRTLMQSTGPIGAVVAGALLGGGDVAAAIVAMTCVIAIPGAIGLVHPALGSEATGEPREPRPGAAADAIPGGQREA